ncbi:hypothetical protein CY675_14830 [Listeria monocytogenes]|uniref:Uncharacterized protein n=1 Tax=Listeria monocytogenes TaxID=1639 RepID=A0A3D8A280_LISMN|nr:hypothetical protein [Listeria monocytogenes]EAC2654594.1 hypothetical protein [Listeria monocytogenes]EAC2666724.1 hypothetical protein [Listeria monocytogenes]EAC3241338.1 hypothetical protein [Listeria monocytogenes]EAC3603439.1 hypothetical protein [Listeria monocytogenes]EAC3845288.1 hypothetical protein [Listeria monocytogenes]
MADIKDLGIFGRNKGLEKMKKDAEEKKRLADTTEKPESIPVTEEAIQVTKKSSAKDVQKKRPSALSQGKKRLVGAPVRKFDRVYAVKTPIKLSPLLNATSRILVEKYATNFSRDELLREALNEYIKQNLSQEDKVDLFNSVQFELNLFRNAKKENQTVPDVDDRGRTIRTVEEIEKETEEELIQGWGIRKNEVAKKDTTSS